MSRGSAFAPGSIGNVGPGFDVLGLAIEAAGDRVTVELTSGESRVVSVTGFDAHMIPLDPDLNVAVIAARAWLREAGIDANPMVTLEKGLPLSGGLGGSAASSVAGALAAAIAAGATPAPESLMAAALEGETLVSGRHLDNIAPAVLGGLSLVRSVDPMDVISIPYPKEWVIALVMPHVRVETKAARGILPELWEREAWVRQMANTASMVHAFSTGDRELMRRSLTDRYAEPRRASLIPRFYEVKRAALDTGAFGCSISGSGPTIFALVLAGDADRCVRAMVAAVGDIGADGFVSAIAKTGARRI